MKTLRNHKVCEKFEILARPNPGHTYAHSTCHQPAAVVAAPPHLNNIATNIHTRAETLLTGGAICEQLMHITSPMLTTFSALVRTAPPSCACRRLETDILGREVGIACLGLSARRPRILVGEVAAWDILSPSSVLKKKTRSGTRTTSFSRHSQNEPFCPYRKSQAIGFGQLSNSPLPEGRKL
jgi:hypothetical protein